jgi:hypothetical protein
MREPEPIYELVRVKKLTGWRLECQECGDLFTSKRKTAEMCGATCRQIRSRRGQQTAETIDTPTANTSPLPRLPQLP